VISRIRLGDMFTYLKSVREHWNATTLTATLPVIQVLSGLIWSMRREQTFCYTIRSSKKKCCNLSVSCMYIHQLKDCNRFFLWFFSECSLFTERLIFTYGSISKNQSFGEQTAFRNLLKKSVTFCLIFTHRQEWYPMARGITLYHILFIYFIIYSYINLILQSCDTKY